jgi:hypothetical protein
MAALDPTAAAAQAALMRAVHRGTPHDQAVARRNFYLAMAAQRTREAQECLVKAAAEDTALAGAEANR